MARRTRGQRDRILPVMIPTPFGTTWEDLSLEALRAFFAEATDEGLTWEAKGGAVRPEHVRTAASAFGNSLLGGFLMLGASRHSGSWTIDGFAFPTEPQTWVSTCLMNDNVRPVPSFDTKVWPLDEERSVVVVSFRPYPVPPVLTRDGHVWERLSGVSKQVTDPASMRDLVHRGERALTDAARISEAGRDDLLNAPPLDRRCSVVVSMASPALLGDASPRVFRESTRRAMGAQLDGSLAMPRISGYVQNRTGGDVSQHALTLCNAGFDEGDGYCIRLGRHGSFAVGASVGLEESGLRAVANDAGALRPAWEAAAHLLGGFVGEAPIHAAIALWDQKVGTTAFARWTTTVGPWTDELESVCREARRALGRSEWEPEDSGSGAH